MVPHATPNGNPVNCQNNMESQGGCVKWVVRVCREYPGIGVLKYQRSVVACQKVSDCEMHVAQLAVSMVWLARPSQ